MTAPQSIGLDRQPVTPATTPSATFERIVTAAGLDRRPRQDHAVALAHHAVITGQRTVVQAPTGVGKSFVALATAADAGSPGRPGIVVTTTNALGNQYLADCRRAAALAGFSYTRVMGATHYACADSDAARADGVPGPDDIGEGQEDAARAHRNTWLDRLAPAGADPAAAWELRTLGLTADYRCPGYPGCAGNRLGGCGSKRARARGFEVGVVISNYHLLAYTHKLGLPLLPLADAAVVVVDEAHELPGVIAEIDGGQLTENTGSRVFAAHPELADAAAQWITASLDRAVFGRSEYDTEAAVPVDLDGMARFARAWLALTPDQQAEIESARSDDTGGFAAGDAFALLRAWAETALGQSTWRAWTSRTLVDRQAGRWQHDRKVQLRRVDACAVVVPAMLPPAAVLLSGTVGQTLPARLGLTDAAVHDLGQEFDWRQVAGRISAHDGVKARIPFEVRKTRDQARLHELADAITPHGGALVLANARTDAVFIGRQLDRLLPGHTVFVAEEGGSLAAEAVKQRYIAHRQLGGRGVLVGVDSFATGLDLPGELCTFVGWWVCVKSASGFYDQAVSVHFAAHGNYLDERFRARFAQGIGRLLRSSTDRGEVMVCDARAARHLRQGLTRVDAHLAHIQWRAA